MDNENVSTELTCEFLQNHLERAARCVSAMIPGDEFRKILKLAMRNKAFAISKLNHLHGLTRQHEVKLAGHDLRVLLMLASKAHPRERRHKLRVV